MIFIKRDSLIAIHTKAETMSTLPGLYANQYSDKSIVVRGDQTVKFKNNLKCLSGKYNYNLRGGAGWIFHIQESSKITDFLTAVNNGDIDPMSDTDYFKSNYYKPIERKDNDSSDVYTLLNLLVNKIKVLEEKIDVLVSKSEDSPQKNCRDPVETTPRSRLLR